MVQTDGIDPGSSVMSNTFSTITESPLQFFFSRYAAVLVAMVRFSLLHLYSKTYRSFRGGRDEPYSAYLRPIRSRSQFKPHKTTHP